jgi:3-hydroxyisobutyrate dehydrogenase-like beta-hydroxyacid dehydrogenase
MIEAAHARKVSLPLTETHRALLEKAEAMGWGAYDNSSIIEALRDSPS